MKQKEQRGGQGNQNLHRWMPDPGPGGQCIPLVSVILKVKRFKEQSAFPARKARPSCAGRALGGWDERTSSEDMFLPSRKASISSGERKVDSTCEAYQTRKRRRRRREQGWQKNGPKSRGLIESIGAVRNETSNRRRVFAKSGNRPG